MQPGGHVIAYNRNDCSFSLEIAGITERRVLAMNAERKQAAEDRRDVVFDRNSSLIYLTIIAQIDLVVCDQTQNQQHRLLRKCTVNLVIYRITVT